MGTEPKSATTDEVRKEAEQIQMQIEKHLDQIFVLQAKIKVQAIKEARVQISNELSEAQKYFENIAKGLIKRPRNDSENEEFAKKNTNFVFEL
jgi:MinD-like ATPase involved in chromosome partitioning or flagellar assembly